ncbi:hypothetical protein ABK040_009593 [Willaertia magna]
MQVVTQKRHVIQQKQQQQHFTQNFIDSKTYKFNNTGENNNDNTLIIIFSIVGSLIFLIFLITIIFLSIYYFIKRRRNNNLLNKNNDRIISPISSYKTPLLITTNNNNENNNNRIGHVSFYQNESFISTTSSVINQNIKYINFNKIRDGLNKVCIIDKDGTLIKSSIAKDLPRLIRKTIIITNQRSKHQQQYLAINEEQIEELEEEEHYISYQLSEEKDMNILCCKFLAELSRELPRALKKRQSLYSLHKMTDHDVKNNNNNHHHQIEEEEEEDNLSIVEDFNETETTGSFSTGTSNPLQSSQYLIQQLNNISPPTPTLENNTTFNNQNVNIYNFELFSTFLRETFGEYSPIVNLLKLSSQACLFEGLNEIRPKLLQKGINFKDFKGKNNWLIKIYPKKYKIIHQRVEQVFDMKTLSNLFTFTYELEVILNKEFSSVEKVNCNLLECNFEKSILNELEQLNEKKKLEEVFSN